MGLRPTKMKTAGRPQRNATVGAREKSCGVTSRWRLWLGKALQILYVANWAATARER
jgi:hypothetical protein